MKHYEKETALKLAKITRAARKQAGYTQLELANLLQVTQGYISKLEKSLLIPSATHWFRFCEIMDLPAYCGQTGYIDQCQKISLSDENQVGLFKIPDAYAFSKGTAVRMSRPLLAYFEEQLGTKRKDDFLLSKGMDPDFFTILDRSLNINFNLDLARELIRVGKMTEETIPHVTSRMNQNGVHVHGELLADYKQTKDPVILLQQFEKNIERYDVNWNYNFDYSKKNQIDIEVTPKLHMKQFNYTDETLGNFVSTYHGHFFRQFLIDSDITFSALKTKSFSFQGQDKCAYQISLG